MTGMLTANRQVAFGALVLALLVGAALAAPLLTPYTPTGVDVLNRLKPPSTAHLFGTDAFGRDVYTRVLFGSRTSVLAGALTMACTVLVGGLVGMLAGYFRGPLDLAVMRVMEAFMAIPAILLAVALIAILGNGLTNVVLALSVAYSPRLARIVRSVVLSVRAETYVESAHAIGVGTVGILSRYILPQVVSVILVQGSFIVAYAIVSEAALSFLGIGTPPPAPSWGNILSDARAYLSVAPWIMLFPGLGLVLIVLALNQLGDGLRDALDPRLRGLG